jgi:hypothetical protein
MKKPKGKIIEYLIVHNAEFVPYAADKLYEKLIRKMEQKQTKPWLTIALENLPNYIRHRLYLTADIYASLETVKISVEMLFWFFSSDPKRIYFNKKFEDAFIKQELQSDQRFEQLLETTI